MVLIHNKGKYTYHIGVRLVPGVSSLNSSDAKAFKEASKLPLNQHLIDSGDIVVPDDFSKGSIVDVQPYQNAVKLVKDTYDLNVLEQFKEEENRESVKKAIDEQIKAIKNPPIEDQKDIE